MKKGIAKKLSLEGTVCSNGGFFDAFNRKASCFHRQAIISELKFLITKTSKWLIQADKTDLIASQFTPSCKGNPCI